MNSSISVQAIVKDTAVVGRFLGGELRMAVTRGIESFSRVVVDFDGIEMITQSSADEFIGRLIRENSRMIESVQFINCSKEVKAMLTWAAENADSVLTRQRAFQAARI